MLKYFLCGKFLVVVAFINFTRKVEIHEILKEICWKENYQGDFRLKDCFRGIWKFLFLKWLIQISLKHCNLFVEFFVLQNELLWHLQNNILNIDRLKNLAGILRNNFYTNIFEWHVYRLKARERNKVQFATIYCKHMNKQTPAFMVCLRFGAQIDPLSPSTLLFIVWRRIFMWVMYCTIFSWFDYWPS